MGSSRTKIAGLTLVIALALSAGCSGKGKATISGEVKYNNAPVTGLNLKIIDKDGKEFTIPLDENGKYTLKLSGFAEGPAKVYFEGPGAGLGTPTAPPKDAPVIGATKVTPLPQKYYSKDTSGLTTDLKAGENTYSPTLQ